MFSQASKAWSNNVSDVDYNEVSNPGWVSCIYWSRDQGQVTVGGRGRELYLGASTKLFIDRNFNHNQQVNMASVKYGISKLVIKADLLSDHFDSKQSRDAVDLPLTCHPSPNLTTFAFRSREVRRLLLDLDPYGGTTHWVCFLFVLRELLMSWLPVLE